MKKEREQRSRSGSRDWVVAFGDDVRGRFQKRERTGFARNLFIHFIGGLGASRWYRT